MTYRAPTGDLLHAMLLAAGPEARHWPELSDGTAAAILDEAAAVAETILGPLDAVGDAAGVTLDDGQVGTAPGWPTAYRAWIAGGWNGVTATEAFGGMGLSTLLGSACFEMWSGANMAFGLAPLLTAGAIEALQVHGSPALQASYLPKLVSGEWTGTMNLTEPQAGSDLGALRTRAERRGDGTYAITGEKIYTTFGDHDMADNIVHLVLARLPDAPQGSRGISLFLVPKALPHAEGCPGPLNDVRCTGLERKLGIHGAPTCTMRFGDQGGATGFVIGEENKGLACMFTMMNNARLNVGLQGVAAAEHATQMAIGFARIRRQGRIDSRASEMTPIVNHPDVARMLMTMKASTTAARAICYRTAAALDAAKRESDPADRGAAAERAALLTPVAKAFSTDIANIVASLNIQVHGGLGFIEGSGAARIFRDVRIAAIYEGTNGIQAIDLVTRKLPAGAGAAVASEIADIRRTIGQMNGRSAFGRTETLLGEACDGLERTARAFLQRGPERLHETLAGATPFLRLFGLVRGAALLVAAALAPDDGASTSRTALARFFAENILPDASGLEKIAAMGGEALAEDRDAWLNAL